VQGASASGSRAIGVRPASVEEMKSLYRGSCCALPDERGPGATRCRAPGPRRRADAVRRGRSPRERLRTSVTSCRRRTGGILPGPSGAGRFFKWRVTYRSLATSNPADACRAGFCSSGREVCGALRAGCTRAAVFQRGPRSGRAPSRIGRVRDTSGRTGARHGNRRARRNFARTCDCGRSDQPNGNKKPAKRDAVAGFPGNAPNCVAVYLVEAAGGLPAPPTIQ
jgi:hypothetical protein